MLAQVTMEKEDILRCSGYHGEGWRAGWRVAPPLLFLPTTSSGQSPHLEKGFHCPTKEFSNINNHLLIIFNQLFGGVLLAQTGSGIYIVMTSNKVLIFIFQPTYLGVKYSD